MSKVYKNFRTCKVTTSSKTHNIHNERKTKIPKRSENDKDDEVSKTSEGGGHRIRKWPRNCTRKSYKCH